MEDETRNEIRRHVAALWSALDKISAEHEELFDTDVREALSEVLWYHFVWGHPVQEWPTGFGMFTAEGDAAVLGAVRAFLDAALPMATRGELPTGRIRHDLLQSGSSSGGRSYDEFIGHADEPTPDERPSPGLYRAPSYGE